MASSLMSLPQSTIHQIKSSHVLNPPLKLAAQQQRWHPIQVRFVFLSQITPKETPKTSKQTDDLVFLTPFNKGHDNNRLSTSASSSKQDVKDSIELNAQKKLNDMKRRALARYGEPPTVSPLSANVTLSARRNFRPPSTGNLKVTPK